MVLTRSMKKNKKDTQAKESSQPFSNLPVDLMLLIISYLSLKDNIRASAVCKTWREACVSVRIEDPTIWLMLFSSDEEIYELYDPSIEESHIHTFPELRGSHIRYSRDGWLLVDNRNRTETFFFNPFTREYVQLPWSDIRISHAIAFSCAPTLDSCVILSVYDITKSYVTIKTYHPATRECTTLIFPNKLPRRYRGFQNVVFSNGVFYCLTYIGCLGMFDLYTSSWNLLSRRPPTCCKLNTRIMAEYQGDIFLICAQDPEKPTFCKLDLTNRKWTEKIKVEGLTFYLGFHSVVTTKKCLMFNQRMNQGNLYHVWIKPSVNVSDMFTS